MPIHFDPKTTALIIIDLQGGILAMPLQPYSGEQIIANITKTATALKQAGGTVVAVTVAFADDLSDLPNQAVDQPMQVPAGGLPAEFSALAPEVVALGAQVHITKRNWSAFYGTELDLQLRRRGITTLILTGIATNYGVESTVRDAWQHHYQVLTLEDGCTSLSDEMHSFSITKVMPRISRITSTAQVLEVLSA